VLVVASRWAGALADVVAVIACTAALTAADRRIGLRAPAPPGDPALPVDRDLP
jgi:hypothetical protein